MPLRPLRPFGYDHLEAKLILARAIKLAAEVHEHQQDLAGEPYILHPIRVMLKQHSELLRIVAVLHDVLEDGGMEVRLTMARIGFPKKVLPLVELLTRKKGQSYEDYIEQIMTDHRAIKVELADLEDNLDPQRVSFLLRQGADPEKVRRRLEKYKAARTKLQDKLNNTEFLFL